MQSLTNEELIACLRWCGHDPYYNEDYEYTVKEIERRLNGGKNMPQKCPHCNVELNYEEREKDQNCGDYYYETWRGYCPKCKKEFYWDEVYNFSCCDNLEETKRVRVI